MAITAASKQGTTQNDLDNARLSASIAGSLALLSGAIEQVLGNRAVLKAVDSNPVVLLRRGAGEDERQLILQRAPGAGDKKLELVVNAWQERQAINLDNIASTASQHILTSIMRGGVFLECLSPVMLRNVVENKTGVKVRI